MDDIESFLLKDSTLVMVFLSPFKISIRIFVSRIIFSKLLLLDFFVLFPYHSTYLQKMKNPVFSLFFFYFVSLFLEHYEYMRTMKHHLYLLLF